MKKPNLRVTLSLLVSGFAFAAPISAQVIFLDDFDDNTNTGWTYLNRNGAEEIADAVWVETGGRLEQQTENYDFPRGAQEEPILGAIALAPQMVGGHYQVSATFTSLEAGNAFQDEDIVFGYVDPDNFFYVETIPERFSLMQVVAGNRVVVAGDVLTFSHDPIVVTVEHNAATGDVVVTYGDAEPQSFSDPAFVLEGEHSVGVGSNNDAFATDDFTITRLGQPEPDFVITELVRDPLTGNVAITWSSILGEQFFLDRSTDLLVWTELEDFPGEVGTTSFEDTGVPEAEEVYYRVRRE